MGTTISDLTQVTTPALADKMVVDQASGTKHLTLAQLKLLFEIEYNRVSSLVKVYDSVPFRFAYYRNKEKDNNLATADQTPITVSSAPSGGLCTLSNFPYDPSIWNPESGKEWQLRPADGVYSNSYKITGGNPSTGVFNVSAAGSSPSLVKGEEVILINPFRTVEWLSDDYLLKRDATKAWMNDQVTAGPIFRHSDGHYVWLFHSKGQGVGYCTADNIEGPYTVSADSPLYLPTDLDPDYDYLGTKGNIIYLPEEERYATILAATDNYLTASSHYHLILWKFDEDFENQEIIDPYYDIATGDGVAVGSLIKFKNTYFMFTLYRTSGLGPYVGPFIFQYVTSDNIEKGDWSSPTVVHTGMTKDTGTSTDYDYSAAYEAEKNGQYYAGWCDWFDPFIYNDTLYVLVGGTSYWSESGFALNDTGTTSNRQIGLWYFDELDNTFKPDPRGAIVINPQDANSALWPDYVELYDHMGTGGAIFVDDDGQVYYSVTIKGTIDGANRYGGTIVKLLIT